MTMMIICSRYEFSISNIIIIIINISIYNSIFLINDNEYSYMNNEIALVGAVFMILTPNPLYNPSTPSLLRIEINKCRALKG